MDGRVFECKLLSCEGFYSVGYCTVERASGVFSRSSTPDAIDDCVGRFNKKTPFRRTWASGVSIVSRNV